MKMLRGFNAGRIQGRAEEKESILMMLEMFFSLTQEPDETGKVTENPEWDNGFQSAISLIRNTQFKLDKRRRK